MDIQSVAKQHNSTGKSLKGADLKIFFENQEDAKDFEHDLRKELPREAKIKSGFDNKDMLYFVEMDVRR